MVVGARTAGQLPTENAEGTPTEPPRPLPMPSGTHDAGMRKPQNNRKSLASKAAAALGRKGGLARYARMSADDRKAQAKRAAAARWSRKSMAVRDLKEDA